MKLTRKQLEDPLSIDLPFNRDYHDLVEGKSVCVVGGAKNSINKEFIENAGLVVGISKNWLDQDYPVDITYSIIDSTYSYLDLEMDERSKALSFAWIWMPSDESIHLARFCKKHNIPFSYYGLPAITMESDVWPETQWFRVLGKALQTLPLTGIAVVYHLLLHPVEKVYVTGMDFWHKPGELLVGKHVHEILPHINFLIRAAETDERLILDDKLQEVITLYDKNRDKLNPQVSEKYWMEKVVKRMEDKNDPVPEP